MTDHGSRSKSHEDKNNKTPKIIVSVKHMKALSTQLKLTKVEDSEIFHGGFVLTRLEPRSQEEVEFKIQSLPLYF